MDEACTLPSQSGLVIGSTLVTMGGWVGVGGLVLVYGGGWGWVSKVFGFG